jgi:hypothetical protein
MPSRRWADLVAICWAIVGVLGGHVLTYALLFPNAHVHEQVLAESGHGWMSLVGPAILTVVVITAGLALLRRRESPTRGVPFALLASLQIGLFVALEVGERLGAGLTIDSFSHHLTDHGLGEILVIGSFIQLLTAWLGTRLSRLVAAAAHEGVGCASWSLGSITRVFATVATLRMIEPIRAQRSRAPPVTS